jgi:molybdopterin synthase catalytic subunit
MEVKQVKVKSLFFASYRDLIGTDELVVDLPEGSTVADLTSVVRARAGSERLPDVVVTAVNQEYASSEKELRNGDEVAFIPPVAGG